MFRKHNIIFGIITALVLLFIATRYYPGGSQFDNNAVGYDFKNNYLSNLFSEKAVNDADNSARPWAIGGMFFLSIGFALFFIDFSKKIPEKNASRVVKYCGIGAMIGGFLAVTPYHDAMVRIASTLALISMFYITVFVYRSKLHFFKVLSTICLIVFYACTFMYYASFYLEYLPIMQKMLLAFVIIWMLGLTYFTKKEDFQPR